MWSNKVRMAFSAAAGILGVCAMPSGAQAQVPGGSYAQSCRNESVGRNGVLRAECRTAMGSWHRTSIVPSDCRNRDIVNVNGQLACGERLGRDQDHQNNGSWKRGGPWRGHHGRDYSGVTLFKGRGFHGQSMAIGEDYSNLGNTGFNDVAASVRIQGGTWRLCSDKNYGGRCVNVSSDVSDLRRIGLGGKISSVRRVD